MITFIYIIRTTHAALWRTCPIHPHVAMQPQFAFFFFCSFNGIFRTAIIFLMRLLYCTTIIYREKWNLRGGQRGDEEMVMVWLRAWEHENIAVGTLIDVEIFSVGALYHPRVYPHVDSKSAPTLQLSVSINLPTAMFSRSHAPNQTITISSSPLCPPRKFHFSL